MRTATKPTRRNDSPYGADMGRIRPLYGHERESRESERERSTVSGVLKVSAKSTQQRSRRLQEGHDRGGTRDRRAEVLRPTE